MVSEMETGYIASKDNSALIEKALIIGKSIRKHNQKAT